MAEVIHHHDLKKRFTPLLPESFVCDPIAICCLLACLGAAPGGLSLEVKNVGFQSEL